MSGCGVEPYETSTLQNVHLYPRLQVTESVSMSAGLHVLYSPTDDR
jgi:hypothetical protein